MDWSSLFEGAIGALILSAAVRALPKPMQPAVTFGQKFYLWFYNFTHGLLANLDKIQRNNAKPK